MGSADDCELPGATETEEPDTITEKHYAEEEMDIDDDEEYFTEEEPEGGNVSYSGYTDG